jgi:UV DNA damage repair endonuclease
MVCAVETGSKMAKRLVEWSKEDLDDLNSKLPPDVRAALDLEADDKAWKDVDNVRQLAESKSPMRAWKSSKR